ncbi:uncharacterized protein LOC133526552 isoform X1 [Cydia pomonella]|uniref:uncharacterized protein LOC133526552 isoform X1 n=1 Tax=Cydia pomonella TaxID=82600 RepID=UPI002ADDF98A|nr:uncharacterized protein LOC133526552 isoform X1 [Cydia pomonella]
MVTKSMFKKCLLFAVIFLMCTCEGRRKIKRKVESFSNVSGNSLKRIVRNSSDIETSRGFFPPGGLFTLGKVLNFFPVGGERECQPSGYKTARAGICLNPYDCRQRDGQSAGDCAHGLGVCCVFEISCGGVVQNNLTYFISPGFPELWTGEKDCNITVEKTHAGIMQLRIDFVHFTIGQPNRRTGECDEDVMIVGEGDNEFRICGQNHGQHIYYTLPTGSEKRDSDDELPSSAVTKITVRMRGTDMPRLWLLRLAQMPLAHSAPHDCRQYYTGNNGTIRTFNYAVNGRHLANHEYRACIRRNSGTCSVRYTPCDNRSFRIGGAEQLDDVVEDEMMPVNEVQPQEDEMEGSGADPQIAPAVPATPAPSMASRIWSYIWPSWLWQARTLSWHWSPYAQHYSLPEDDKIRYTGYGTFGEGLKGGYGRLRCKDRITIPCENEYFVSSSILMSGVCDPHHCGSSFCPNRSPRDCHVDTSITPFAVSVHFGPPSLKLNPEENIGACLRYTQVPCDA